MSDISGPFSIYIEAWSGITGTDVIPSGQKRWYSGVTGYGADEVLEVIGDNVTQLQNLPLRQVLEDGAQDIYGVKTFDDIPVLPASNPTSDNQAVRKAYVDGLVSQTYDVEDTDSADVAATTPTSPSDGDKWNEVNSGSSGNHVTGLPGSISLGDGKRCDFIYDSTNTTWRYEDIIIDEESGGATGTNVGTTNSTYRYFKYSGGSIRVLFYINQTSATQTTPTLPVTFVSMDSKHGNADNGYEQVANVRFDPDVAATTFRVMNQNGTTLSVDAYVSYEGRWKA